MVVGYKIRIFRGNNIVEHIRKELLSLHNIIKDGDDYKLQNNYYEDGDRVIAVIPYEDGDNHICQLCRHFILTNKSTCSGYCEIYNKLLNLSEHQFVYTGRVINCAAYDKVERMNIIHSLDDMIAFIERVQNFFGCPEDYESYFGFTRNWDEETGEILETVREYYNRGGKFTNIPTEYPCVIRFDWDCEDDLEWIYIGRGINYEKI